MADDGKIRVVIEGDSSSLQNASKTGAKSVEDFGGKTLEARQKADLLHLGLENLGAKFPELGLLTRLFFNPLTAGFSAAALGEELFFKWQEKTEQKYHDLISAAQKVNDDIREIVQSSKTADNNFIDLQEAMGTAREAGRGLAADMERDAELAAAMKEAFDASADRIAQVHKDTADLSSKLVDLLVATGQVSPERGKMMDLEIQHAQKLQEFADARAKAAGDVSQAQSAFAHAENDYTAAGGANREEIYTRKQTADARVERLEKTIAENDKIVSDAKAAIAAAKSDLSNHALDPAAAQKDRDLIASLQNTLTKQEAAYDKAKQELPGAELDKAGADKAVPDLEAAAKKLAEMADAVQKAQQKLAELTASQQAQIPSINREFAAGEAADLFKGGATVQSLVAAVNSPGGTAAQHQQAVQNLGTVLTALGQSSESINGIVTALMNHTVTNATEVGFLKQQLAALAMRMSALPVHTNSGSN